MLGPRCAAVLSGPTGLVASRRSFSWGVKGVSRLGAPATPLAPGRKGGGGRLCLIPSRRAVLLVLSRRTDRLWRSTIMSGKH